MTTIHPLGLSEAITVHDVELLDVRSTQDFERGHIHGARSMPLSSFHAAQVVRERGFANRAPLFLISRRRTKASLAAGMLRAAGCAQPVVVEGGMQLWESQGLRVVRTKRHPGIALAERVRDLAGPQINRLRGDCRRAAERLKKQWQRHLVSAWWRGRDFRPRKSLARLAGHFSLSK